MEAPRVRLFIDAASGFPTGMELVRAHPGQRARGVFQRCRSPALVRSVGAELASVVKREGIAVERVFAEHLPATPWGDRAR